jgi:hypothetical protein
MKSILTVFLLSVLTTVTCFGQNKDISSVQKALETLRIQMIDPTESGLKAISHPSITYGHSNGKIENQKEFMEALLTGTSDFTALSFSDIKIEIVGKTAMVRHLLNGETIDKSKQVGKINIKVMLVFVQNKSGWVLLGRQAVKYI